MYWSSDPVWAAYFGIPLLGLFGIAAVILWVYTTQRHRRGTTWFVALGGAACAFLLVHLVYLLETDPGRMGRLLRLQIWLAMTTYATFVVFVSIYTGRGFHTRRPVQAGIAFVVVGSVALAATDGFHDLLTTDAVAVTEPFPYVQNEPGIGFVAVIVVLLSLVGYSWYVLLFHVLETEKRSGAQLLSLLLGAFAVAIAEVIGSTSIMPADGFHHNTWGLLVFAVFCAFALFKFRLFAAPPVTRNAIVEELHDPILILDDDRRIVDFNRASADRWPAIADRVGEPLDAVAPDLADEIDLASGEASSTTFRLRSEDEGEKRDFSASVTPVRRRHSEEVGWYAVDLRDVTAIERSRTRLETQNERLDRVAGTVSHDLRNPIQVATGYLDLLETEVRERAPDDEDPDAVATLSDLDATFDRMNGIIEDVLTLVRHGAAVEETQSLSLSAAAREAWSGIDTGDATLEIADDRTIRADRRRLLAMFEQLFRNSVEHGPPDRTRDETDEPESRTRDETDEPESRTRDETDEPESRTRGASGSRSVTVTVGGRSGGFYVADDGVGIPSERADWLFEYGTTSIEGRSGFGLPLVRTVAEAHGWSVALDPEYADGARFVVTATGTSAAARAEAISAGESSDAFAFDASPAGPQGGDHGGRRS